MNLKTVVDAFSGRQLLWTVRTRRDLERRLGFEVFSRNENGRRWKIADPAGVDSLCPVDEAAAGMMARIQLYTRFEKASSGNAKQRRACRRQK